MKVLLVGCGAMAKEYAKVLCSLNVNFDAVGKGDENIAKFKLDFPNIVVYSGGLEKNANILTNYSHVIIATNVVSLAQNVILLLKKSTPYILVEKPGFATPQEAEEIYKECQISNSNLFVAYNRRFLASTLKAKELIEKDGGVLSFNFEFTEWSHVIEKLQCPDIEKNFLFLANSTHVVDLAFFLGGKIKEISTYRAGELSWHRNGAVFSGAGICTNGALFSYNANWISAGRWSLEILTQYSKLIFRPLEKLQLQNKGSLAINFIEDIDYTLDEKFKPGLYLQVLEFLKDQPSKDLCGFLDQYATLDSVYRKISGY